MLKIGNLRLNSRLILAPMSGISDLPFRLLNRKFGAELAFVEMINVRSLGYNSRKTSQMLSTNKEDKPLGVQILGCEQDYILRALDILKSYKYDILDFNAACPVKKVTRRGEGASLLKDPLKLQRLLKLVVENSRVPVTVKIRIGWDKNSINAREVALYAQGAGASALFIHGRTKTQGYGGEVDYRVIRQVKKSLDIPVIASGNVFSAGLAEKMFDETGCDAVLVARGALGNPWFFRKAKELPQADEVARAMLEHLDSCIDFYGARNAVSIFHKFFGWYSRGFRKIRRLREKAYRAKTRQEMCRVIEEFRGYKRVGQKAG
ncbi:MAG: tRNA dihydrouridine synthase DusB [Candidatus Omnitrophica bacterium]|nr:tRNA dihydrouridine synthase DusB [Candidatus Omnitrophota bacterium]